jgi:hypothetical protein
MLATPVWSTYGDRSVLSFLIAHYTSGRAAPAGDEARRIAANIARCRPKQPLAHASLDHLVGCRKQRGGNGETKRLHRLEVDHQLKLHWSLNGRPPRINEFLDFLNGVTLVERDFLLP